MSFSSDEMSAISRLRFDNFSDLITHGVKLNDMHPAGVQVFLWLWSKAFGVGEFITRLPFILAGTASIYFLYSIGKRWFNKRTGLIAAALLAFMSYPILYSQLARPYAFGLFFGLLAVHYWTRIFIDQSTVKKSFIGFGLALTGCMLTHYYCFLFMGFVVLSGFIFINRNNWKGYVLSLLGTGILYLPHLPILMHQLGRGGLQGWLGAPEQGWTRNYLFYAFNESPVLIICLLTLWLVGLLKHYKTFQNWKRPAVAATWFVLPLIAGYIYSQLVNPILQYSVLLFSFPFLLLFISHVLARIKLIPSPYLLALVCVFTLFTTIVEQNYYGTYHFGVLKELAIDQKKWDQRYGPENITRVANVNDSSFIQYYLKDIDHPEEFEIYDLTEPEDLIELNSILQESSTPYLSLLWSTRNTPKMAYELILEHYPKVVAQNRYNHSESFLCTRGPSNRKAFRTFAHNFNGEGEQNWFGNEQTVKANQGINGTTGVALDSSDQFSPMFKIRVGDIKNREEAYLRVSCQIKRQANTSVHLVYQVERNGELMERDFGKTWYGWDHSNYSDKTGIWEEAFYARIFDPFLKPEDTITFYVWNSGKGNVQLDDMEVSIVREMYLSN